MVRPYTHPALRKLPERDRALVAQTNEKTLAELAALLHRATATGNPSLVHGAESHLVRQRHCERGEAVTAPVPRGRGPRLTRPSPTPPRCP